MLGDAAKETLDQGEPSEDAHHHQAGPEITGLGQ